MQENAKVWFRILIKNGEIDEMPVDRVCFLRSEFRAILREKGYSLDERKELVDSIDYTELSNYILNNLGI